MEGRGFICRFVDEGEGDDMQILQWYLKGKTNGLIERNEVLSIAGERIMHMMLP